MLLSDLLSTIIPIGGGGLIVLILGLIKVKPLEISVWQWLFRTLGRWTNGDITDKVGTLQKDLEGVKDALNGHIVDSRVEDIKLCRRRILIFSDEIYNKVDHSKEHFDDILSDISEYNKYCAEHTDFPNERAVLAIKLIEGTYQEKLKSGSF